MANLFEAIVIAVAVVGFLLSLTLFSPRPAFRELGRLGGAWFEHEEDRRLEERPEPDRDPPIPFRPLRGRP